MKRYDVGKVVLACSLSVLVAITTAALLAGCGEKVVNHTVTKTTTVKQPGVTAPAPPPKVIHVPPPDGNLSQVSCKGIELGTNWTDIVHKYGWPDDLSQLSKVKFDANGTPDQLPYPIRNTGGKQHCRLLMNRHIKQSGNRGENYGNVESKQLELP